MSKKIDNILYNLIVESNIVEKSALDNLISKNKKLAGSALIDELSRLKLADEADLLKKLAGKMALEFASVKDDAPPTGLTAKIPVKIASYYQFVPLKLEGNSLTIAVRYPLDIAIEDEIRFQLGFDIKQVLITNKELVELIRKVYGFGAETIDKIVKKDKQTSVVREPEEKKDIEDIEIIGKDATVANLVNEIIYDAYKKRATDIHIEPYRSYARFRYRIDGILYDANVSADVRHYLQPILSRIKIMSNLDIVEHRLPQDGQAVVKIKEERLDLRVSFIPTPFGESVVIRILPTVVLYDLDKLGLSEKEKNTISDLLDRPNGIIFVTGPTGSGKTTTLYACLSKLNTKENKIITIEDPIEYEIPGITQIQVNPQIGLTFAQGLRSMLRHDPDIMMVGEVRDLETAEISIRVALTGHLVFSTIHTNSAAASIHRLIDIGIEPYLIYSSTIAFIAQRLIRVLCPKCKKPIEKIDGRVAALIKSRLRPSPDRRYSVFTSAGCDFCNNTGYYGRTAIYEILLVDEAIRDLIQQKASAEEIERMAASRGMKTLIQSGLEKLIDGITSIDEIYNTLTIGPEELMRKDASNITLQSGKTDGSQIPYITERRTYTRADKSFPVSFTIYKNLRQGTSNLALEGVSEIDYWKEHNAFTENISSGGLIFKYNLALPQGTILNLKLGVPISSDKELTIVNCLARIVRVDKIPGENMARTAVCFLDMSGADRVALNNYVERIVG